MHNNLTAFAANGIPAAIAAVLTYLFGPFEGPLIVLVAVMALDYVTGVASAAVRKQLSSYLGFKGLVKKGFILALVALGCMLDKLAPSTHGAVRNAVCMFYIANEGLSILENAGEMGLPLPAALSAAITKLRGKASDEEAD